MYWVVEAWVRPNSAPKAFCSSIEFTQKLHLKPAFASLDNLGW